MPPSEIILKEGRGSSKTYEDALEVACNNEQKWALEYLGMEHASPEETRENAWDDVYFHIFPLSIPMLRKILLEQDYVLSEFAMTHDDSDDYDEDQIQEWLEPYHEMVSEISACMSNAAVERFNGEVDVVCRAGRSGIRFSHVCLPRDRSNLDRYVPTPY